MFQTIEIHPLASVRLIFGGSIVAHNTTWEDWCFSHVFHGSSAGETSREQLQELGRPDELEVVTLPAVTEWTAQLFHAVQRGDALWMKKGNGVDG